MDSTNNQIYKVAKYLDKYTKEGNNNNDVYLQKLNNYKRKLYIFINVNYTYL